MRKLHGCAVGAGYFSQFHFDAWNRIEDVNLVGICDVDQDKAQQAAHDFQIERSYADFEKMLDAEKPDFVDIITRPDSHLELVNAAVLRHIPIICQKPLAPSFSEAKVIVKAAHDAHVPLMVHENFRFQPWYREIRRLVENGTIGDQLHTISMQTRMGDGWQKDAYLARQPYFRTMERFLIFETGVHFIDTFRSLAGEVKSVFAALRKLNADIAGEDAAIVVFEFDNGACGTWDANRFNESNAHDPRFTFGQMLVEGNGGSIRLYSDGRITIQKLGSNEQLHNYSLSEKNFAGDCVFTTQHHFVDCLKRCRAFETSGSEYLKTLAVQEAIYASAESGMLTQVEADVEI